VYAYSNRLFNVHLSLNHENSTFTNLLFMMSRGGDFVPSGIDKTVKFEINILKGIYNRLGCLGLGRGFLIHNAIFWCSHF
jgi:hypothetical protein